jgi:hypothetical protein
MAKDKVEKELESTLDPIIEEPMISNPLLSAYEFAIGSNQSTAIIGALHTLDESNKQDKQADDWKDIFDAFLCFPANCDWMSWLNNFKRRNQ